MLAWLVKKSKWAKPREAELALEPSASEPWVFRPAPVVGMVIVQH
jgi:hypothetical protein